MATYRRSDLLKQEDLEKRSMKKRMLTGGQAKLDKNKDNKIDAQDFKILKAEKAKGRGMGLQDESIKPGKVMKAKRGKFLGSDPTKPISSVKPLGTLGKGMKVSKAHSIVLGKMSNEKLKEMVKTGINPDLKGDPNIKRGSQKTSMEAKSFLDRRKELAKASDILKKKKLPGAIGTALGIGAMMVPAAYAAAKQYKDYKSAKNRDEAKVKKMGGGMAKKYSVGGGADMGVKRDFDKITERTKTYAKAESMKDRDRLTNSDIKQATNAAPTEVLKKAKAYYAAYNREARRDLKPSQRKMAGGSVKKYSDGMSYKDMEPYGGKYAKKKNEMKATASENVKRLTTQPDAYDPEERYLVGEKRRRNSTVRTVRKTTDQVNLREAANKLKEQAGPGFNVSINTRSDLIRKRLIRPKRMAGRMGGGMMQRPMGYKSGTMVKARGCKLGRTRPTKIT